MPADNVSSLFYLVGTFGGNVFTLAGKRRMLLRTGELTYLLKVPRLLRRRVIGSFREGQEIRVSGFQDYGRDGVVTKRTVTRIVAGERVFADEQAKASSPTILVCAKKNCWRSGGRELMQALKSELAARGLTDSVEIKAVSCLDRCQMAPNADTPFRQYRCCQARDAQAMVTETAEALSLRV